MRKLIITILLLLPLSAIAADKTFSAGESLTLTSNTTWDSAYSNATKTDWAVVTGAYNISPAEGGNGDGLLFYPGFAGEFGSSPGGANTPDIGGRHDIPIESMRLKLIRDALEDMEYFTLIDVAGKTSEANTYVNTMFTQTDDIDLIYWDLKTDVDTFLAARENIGELLGSSPSTPTIRAGGIRNGGLRP